MASTRACSIGSWTARRRCPASWIPCFGASNATSFRDELRERPAPDLSCPECPNDDVRVGEKAADGAKVERWYNCPDCGYETPSRIVYGPER